MRTEDRKLDYTGQDIYCGFDVHKKRWKMTSCTTHMVMNTISIERPFVDNVRDYLNKKFPGGTYYGAYEAGFSGFWAQRKLTELGIQTIVVHPADIPTTDKDRDQKDDQRDSRKISTSLRSGQLRGIYVPSEEQVKDRNVIRERGSAAKSERRVKHQIKSHLMFMGFEIPEDLEKRYWSSRFIKCDPELLFKYEAYRKKMRAQKAIIKIARILLRRIRWVWMNNEKYQKVEC